MNWCFTVFDLPFPLAAVPEKTRQRDVRPQSINMHVEAATRTKDTEHLGDHSLWFIAMVKNSVAIYIIKALICKREMPRIGLVDDCETTHPQTGELYMFCGQIDSRSRGSVFGELKKIAPGSAADFENLLPPMPAKFCCVIKPWIGGVAILLGEK